jgi:hypothetical protein
MNYYKPKIFLSEEQVKELLETQERARKIPISLLESEIKIYEQRCGIEKRGADLLLDCLYGEDILEKQTYLIMLRIYRERNPEHK